MLDKTDVDLGIVFEKLSSKNNLRDYQTESSFVDIILDEDYIIFIDENFVAPCKFTVHPTGLKTLEVHAAKMVGEGDEILNLRAAMVRIEDYCKHVGIDRIVVKGRRGMARVLPDFHLESITIIKNLEK